MLTFGHTRLVRHKTSCKKPGFISIHNVLENDGVVHLTALCVRRRCQKRESTECNDAAAYDFGDLIFIFYYVNTSFIINKFVIKC